MNQVNTDARQLKENIIRNNEKMTIFLANSQQHINPEHLAELQQKLDSLETKIKESFTEDDRLDPIIAEYTAHIAKQEELIKFVQSKLAKTKKNVEDMGVDQEFGEVLEGV